MPLELDPELATALAALSAGHALPPPAALSDVAARRATVCEGIRALAGPMPDGVTTTDYYATAIDGHKICLRLYRPHADKPSPDQNPEAVVYYIHGGGMILGSVDIYNSIVARYAVQTDVPFLAVDYRLAPEHPYPTHVDDCCAGLAWLAATELGLTVDRVALMGESAGGGLAVATSLRARELQCALRPSMLILLAPMLDDRTIQADVHLEGVVSWTAVDNITGWSALLGTRERMCLLRQLLRV